MFVSFLSGLSNRWRSFFFIKGPRQVLLVGSGCSRNRYTHVLLSFPLRWCDGWIAVRTALFIVIPLTSILCPCRTEKTARTLLAWTLCCWIALHNVALSIDPPTIYFYFLCLFYMSFPRLVLHWLKNVSRKHPWSSRLKRTWFVSRMRRWIMKSLLSLSKKVPLYPGTCL